MLDDSSTDPLKASLQKMRVDYRLGALDEGSADADPIAQFRLWFAESQAAKLPEANAMTLSTATPAGRPSGRVVLLKAMDARGFTFFTNYDSRKGQELDANPWAALTFFWQPLERQVRIEGSIERVTRAESEAYFRVRPVEAQIGAWVSQQSHVLSSRAELEKRQAEMAARFAGQPVPLPDFWGGVRVVPNAMEFWQGRQNRLHDRLLYTRSAVGAGWTRQRLAP